MEYQDLINKVSSETHYTPREIRKLLRTMTRIIRDAVAEGRDVQIYGLGRFKNLLAKAKEVRDPKTGGRMILPERRRLKFSPCDEMAEAIDRSALVYRPVPVEARFGLDKIKAPTRGMDIIKGDRRGKIRSGHRSGEGSEGKEGGGGG
jgi:nucleoid DNA-binding protein